MKGLIEFLTWLFPDCGDSVILRVTYRDGEPDFFPCNYYVAKLAMREIALQFSDIARAKILRLGDPELAAARSFRSKVAIPYLVPGSLGMH